jgi:glutamate formiminotransferase
MESLLECVPNFSEGRRQDTIDAIVRAASGHAGAWPLDVSADADHNRSVLTMAGDPGGVTVAVEAAFATALARIDLREHEGRHPRIGAVDVVPFVPLADMTMARCVEVARSFGAQVAERFGVPVYLYAEAARRPERRVLATIRRPGFEGLAQAMRDRDHEPDLGPRQPHPSAGATVVGARPFLIAFNIQLATDDVAVARRMAARVRERDGGLPAVQALGLFLASRGCAQLSMNLLDHTRTPLWRIWETVDEEARREGVDVLDSELVGLAPLAALTEVAEHIGVVSGAATDDERIGEVARISEAARWLHIRDFDPMMALELRLAAMRSAG